MMSQIYVFIGFLALLGSLAFNAIQGTQLALLGVGFILLGVFNVLNQIKKELQKQNSVE